MAENNWTLWFCGLHGSGKSTIANRLKKELENKEVSAVLLDGGIVRKNISPDLGYSLEERTEHMKRVAGVCNLVSQSGVLTIAAVASLTEESREYAREILDKMILVYVKCPFDVCEKRDIKGHYKKSKENAEGFENFNVSFNFEEPKNPDVTLDTDKESPEESVKKILNYLIERKIIER